MASSALWRAYRALSAARYHLQGHPLEDSVRQVRGSVEELWQETTPEREEEEVAADAEVDAA